MSREYESGCLRAPNPALHPRDDDGTETRVGCVPGCTMRPGHYPPCCTCGPGSAVCKRGCPDYRGSLNLTSEAAYLGNPVRTSAVVRDEAIRAAVTEALAPLTRDLGLAVEALAARHPLPTRDHASLGYVVLHTDPDTGAAHTWTEHVYPSREAAQDVIDDIFATYTKQRLSVAEIRRAS